MSAAVAVQEAHVESVQGRQETWIDLDVLTKHGITKTDINKFKEAGYHTVMSLQVTVDKTLLNVKGITEKKLQDVKKACQKENGVGFITGTEALNKRKDVTLLTTGVKELDKLLGGGLESMAITEIFGEFRTGKTQLVHTLVVSSMLAKEDGGGQGKVVVIDTEGSFRPEKIPPIAERFGVDANEVLDNLAICRVFNSDHQMECFRELSVLLKDDGPFSMIIVDSMTSLLRVDYQGRGELSCRQQMLGQMLSKLIKLANEFNVGVLITNQVMSNPDGGMTFVSDPKKPVGGHVLAHASTVRLEMKKGRGDCRICKIHDHPTMPEGEATFQLSDRGIIDPEG